MLNRQQAIIWTSDDLGFRRIYTSLSLNESATDFLYFVYRCLESHWFVWVSQSNHIPMEIDDDKARPWLSLQVCMHLTRNRLIFFITKYEIMFPFTVISQYWVDAHCWNHPSWVTRTCLFSMINTVKCRYNAVFGVQEIDRVIAVTAL